MPLPEPPTPSYFVAWSAAPAAIGVGEVAFEHQLTDRYALQWLVGIGHGTESLVSSHFANGIAPLVDRWMVEASVQARRYLIGQFDRGLWLGLELRGMKLYAEDQPVTAGAVGARAGAKWRMWSGWSVEGSGGFGVLLTSLVQRGSNERLYHASGQPIVQVLLGWQW